jgi:hypothetical protein|tara:strand:+ start:171 stop:647 length:477 start_codon:yes stop_codon:yes gene_type:complete
MPFWKWWTSIVIIALAISYAQYQFDILNFVYTNDPTRITAIIGIIFLLCTTRIGYLGWQNQFTSEYDTQFLNNNNDLLWFCSDVVMSIGMVGTLIGFLIVLTTTFTNIDTTSAQAMKEVIGTLASGMGIALMTSLIGLISSIILKFQLVMLENSNEEI